MTTDWRARAAAVIPGGTSTGSKRPDSMFGAGHAGPTHITDASGCRLRTTGDTWLIDLTAALGAVSIGYADGAVTEAVERHRMTRLRRRIAVHFGKVKRQQLVIFAKSIEPFNFEVEVTRHEIGEFDCCCT